MTTPSQHIPQPVLTLICKVEECKPLMVGFRGCRLAITYPEIGRMQVRAILAGGGVQNNPSAPRSISSSCYMLRASA
jgi:hypothetical protein